MDHFPYLFAAYSIIFAAIFGYVLYLRRQHRALESELREVEARVKDLTGASNRSRGAD